jgi:hypothetical protein
VISKRLKAELIEEYDLAYQAIQEAARSLNDYVGAVSVADFGLGQSASRMIDEVLNAAAGLHSIRRRLDEVKTRD